MQTQSPARIDPNDLKAYLQTGKEIALLDVREPGEFGEDHLLYAVNTPYSVLEQDVLRLVPNHSVKVVLVDARGDDLVYTAASRLQDVGYLDVNVLSGGLASWKASGYEVFAGVNVPSKAFGELAEHFYHTPRITAQELAERQRRGDRLAIFDGRPYAEYQKMNIPGARCCPNGELALRIDDLVPDESTPIIINCAGRTRSIIGAQTLINLGIPNPVYALENGTQGWFLADQALEYGSSHEWPPAMPRNVQVQRSRAQALATRFGIQTISAAVYNDLVLDTARTTYLCDVRNPEEYRKDHLPNAISAPGGQLIQATDQYIGVRGARLVLWDGDGVRAGVVAHWLVQLGWEVYVMDPNTTPAQISTSLPAHTPTQSIAWIDAAQLLEKISAGAALIDMRSSAAYRKLHVKDAVWLTRRDIKSYLRRNPNDQVIFITSEQRELGYCALDAKEAGAEHIAAFCFAEQEAKSLPLETTPNSPSDADRIDYLFFVHDRHDGNKAAARQYLAWELNLVEQLDDVEKASFRIGPAST